jgi:hypothetical protein
VGEIVTRHTHPERVEMTMQYALMSHGEVLAYTGAALPLDELPSDATVWHLDPTTAFDFVEPIVAELTAPPALALVEDVIPAQDAYLHPAWNEHEEQMERLVHEAARIHHFRLVLERYEDLELELRDASGRRVATTTLLVSKQLVGTDAQHPHATPVGARNGNRVDAGGACYLLMARLTSASVEKMETVASAA